MRGLRSVRHRLVSSGGLAVIAVVTCLALLALDRALAPWRIDLTEARIWTLTPATRALLAELPAPVTLEFYFSRSAASEAPNLSDYARFVGDTLAAFERAAAGRVLVRPVDPRPLSPEEDAARAAGLEPFSLGRSGEELFFGIVARGAGDRTQVLPRLLPEEDALLEYRLAYLLDALSRAQAPRVALVSGIPLAPGVDEAGRRRPGTEIHRRLAERFRLVTGTAEDAAADLGDVDVLVLVHPRDLSEASRWAVDQFVLAGGRALVFVDPLAERDPAADALAFANPFAPRASGADELLAAWGLERAEGVLLDAEHAMPVTLAPGRPAIRHLAMLALTRAAFATDDPVMARIEQLNLSTAGALRPLPEATTRFEPLVTSGPASALLAADRLLRTRDPGALELLFEADDRRHVVAARVRGTARSAFVDVPGFATERREGGIDVLVIADTDLLADALWRAPGTDGAGGGSAGAWASNGDFVVNAVDHLAGSDALLGIRGLPRFARPFTRIEALRREAEARLLARLNTLEGALAAARTSPEMPPDAATAGEQARLRAEIRSVQRALRADVERLTVRVELIGVFAAPLLVVGVATLLALRRRLALRIRRRAAA